MQRGSGRCHMLEVAEDTAGDQRRVDLGVQRPLPFVRTVVNARLTRSWSKAPQPRSRSSRLCAITRTRSSPRNRAPAAASIVGEELSATPSLCGRSIRNNASSRPSPVPRSRIRRASRGTKSSSTASPSVRWGIWSARARYLQRVGRGGVFVQTGSGRHSWSGGANATGRPGEAAARGRPGVRRMSGWRADEVRTRTVAAPSRLGTGEGPFLPQTGPVAPAGRARQLSPRPTPVRICATGRSARCSRA